MTDKAAEGYESGGEAAQEAGAKGPDELRRQIERTRSQLGDTVEELAGKADVKGRVQARAADMRDRAGAMTVQLRSSAAQAGHTVQGKATQAGHAVQDRANRAGHTVEHNLPEPVRNAVHAGARHRGPMVAAGVAVGAVAAVAVLRHRRHGR
ncbi:DUF3618 domain-containing protein [Streptomyces resistomycificus]|uniref:Alanine-rich protein n=1 Tax=Streptomyces resistomycificus TaxID=67356 RepID=A0A0L8KY75_9ACTN|nr:DUF3618 domain-containing protein [Streptomyces resistomycificus]KOG30856.1 hypothetical protein ADK37_32810 [Streptomyces resistomycificus]KUN91731.1 hypothetical protein AQJ84_35105 [Streptomyces resistomycificus]